MIIEIIKIVVPAIVTIFSAFVGYFKLKNQLKNKTEDMKIENKKIIELLNTNSITRINELNAITENRIKEYREIKRIDNEISNNEFINSIVKGIIKSTKN